MLAAALFHEAEYGADVASAPRFAPSTRNCTPTTPTVSDAFAVTATVPETVEPFAGAVTETVGGVVSEDVVVVNVLFEPTASFPAASLERTR